MTIRDEQPGDAGRIARIQYAAFKGHPMHPPGAEPFEHLVVERLREAGALSLSLLAEEGPEAVGHIALSPAAVGRAVAGWHVLGPVGVLPERQGRGVGSALIREALSRMKDKGALGLVLVGEPEFYTRFGFRNAPGLTYSGVPDRFVLALAFAGETPPGEITVHAAFCPRED